MKKYILFLVLIFTVLNGRGQSNDSIPSQIQNSAQKIMANDSKLVIGAYGEVHYNQKIDKNKRYNGILDVHRLVLLTGYKFNRKLQFISEIEFEHVKEVYVEQAFMQYKLSPWLNFRAGLMLIPVGLINEYHEPTVFHGVERPLIDKYIVPSTWREIGLGFNGTFIDASLNYQLYLVNGFNGYNGEAKLNGKNGLRKGRQKGAESYISSPSVTAKLNYFGFSNLKFGLSAYVGRTQSTLFDGINRNDEAIIALADSSTVGIRLVGFDARYQKNGLQLKGQFYYAAITNSGAYNMFTAQDGVYNDLGSALMGNYIEAAYDVFSTKNSIKQALIPFIRYSYLNTHFDTSGAIDKNAGFEKQIVTCGISYFPSKGVVLKSDVQFVKATNQDNFESTFNAGVGIMF